MMFLAKSYFTLRFFSSIPNVVVLQMSSVSTCFTRVSGSEKSSSHLSQATWSKSFGVFLLLIAMVNMSPISLGLIIPLPNGRTSWLINGGDPNYLHPWKLTNDIVTSPFSIGFIHLHSWWMFYCHVSFRGGGYMIEVSLKTFFGRNCSEDIFGRKMKSHLLEQNYDYICIYKKEYTNIYIIYEYTLFNANLIKSRLRLNTKQLQGWRELFSSKLFGSKLQPKTTPAATPQGICLKLHMTK